MQKEWIDQALAAAQQAAAAGDVPVGAVVVCHDRLIACTANRVIRDGDPTAHAEVLALRQAAAQLGRPRLDDCTLYVTLEPCTMCAGAISLARVARLIFGAHDPKGGAVESGGRFFYQPTCLHRPHVQSGVAAEPASNLLRQFFASRR